MGLDNGIILTSNKPFRFPKRLLPTFADDDWGEQEQGQEKLDGNKYKIDYLYWRRHWDFRNSVVNLLGLSRDGGTCKLTLDDAKKVYSLLEATDEYAEDGEYVGRIFAYKIYKTRQYADVRRMKHVIRLMKRGKVSAYFYDSY